MKTCNNNQRYLVRVTLDSKADKLVALISRSNWNLECWLLWREENRRTWRKTLGAGTRTNNKLNPRDAGSGNQARATAMGGERSHHCTIPAPLFPCLVEQVLILLLYYLLNVQNMKTQDKTKTRT